MRWRLSAALLLPVIAAAVGVVWLFQQPVDLAPYRQADASPVLLDRNGRLLYPYLNTAEQWRFPIELDTCNRRLIEATIAVEDQRFYSHPGVDLLAILRATLQNLRAGGVESGASTLSMQAVKLHEGERGGLTGKLAQAWQALRIERRLEKAEILAAYLNSAPYGQNLVGAEAAARRYFGKPAAELTLPEAALLAGLPQAPSALEPLAHPERALARRNHVLHRMRDEGFISVEEHDRALRTELAAAWHEFPRLAPHLAMSMEDAVRAEGAVRLTLDEGIQRQVETYLPEALRRFNGHITNAAAIVVDASTGDVLARVGSAGFFEAPGGQVDLCAAPRSPGSTLKPFTYALALDQQVLYASELLLDDTADYGQYNPENFDGEYHGLVSAEKALRASLNVPAVTILDRYGTPALLGFLRQIGLSSIKGAPDHYGLGLTLGNCEVRLDEMAAAYGMLAAAGEWRPLRLRMDTAPVAPVRVLSRGACLNIWQALAQPFPAEADEGLVRGSGVSLPVCWKTGTSTGFHDAWTFAYNQHYVVGVWLGNNNGKPSKQLVGAHAALPIASHLFRSLPPKSEAAAPEVGEDLRPVPVCAASGLPATQWCKAKREALLPASQYLHRRCDVHYPAPEGGVIERWPGTSRTWDLAKINAPKPNEPSLHSALRTPHSEFPERSALKILSPAENGQYIFTGESQGDSIELRSSIPAGTYWYHNGQFVGETTAQGPLYLGLTVGEHTVACMTADGQVDEVQFEVTLPEGVVEVEG
jgi:penicillin-binding protein 1C